MDCTWNLYWWKIYIVTMSVKCQVSYAYCEGSVHASEKWTWTSIWNPFHYQTIVTWGLGGMGLSPKFQLAQLSNEYNNTVGVHTYIFIVYVCTENSKKCNINKHYITWIIWTSLQFHVSGQYNSYRDNKHLLHKTT